VSTHNYVISKRYKCKEGMCAPSSKERYTFKGFDSNVLPLFPDSVGDMFPAFLTHRSGISKQLIDWMLPLFNKGVRPHALSEILLAHHKKQHM